MSKHSREHEAIDNALEDHGARLIRLENMDEYRARQAQTQTLERRNADGLVLRQGIRLRKLEERVNALTETLEGMELQTEDEVVQMHPETARVIAQLEKSLANHKECVRLQDKDREKLRGIIAGLREELSAALATNVDTTEALQRELAIVRRANADLVKENEGQDGIIANQLAHITALEATILRLQAEKDEAWAAPLLGKPALTPTPERTCSNCQRNDECPDHLQGDGVACGGWQRMEQEGAGQPESPADVPESTNAVSGPTGCHSGASGASGKDPFSRDYSCRTCRDHANCTHTGRAEGKGCQQWAEDLFPDESAPAASE
jgi:hypothetical protein